MISFLIVLVLLHSNGNDSISILFIGRFKNLLDFQPYQQYWLPYTEVSFVFTVDMAVQNVIGDSFRGATWVALHNGGGVGW